MTLEELLWKVNDNTVVVISSSETGEEIALYDGKDSIPEKYNAYEVTDIFVNENELGIEIREEEI